MAARLILNIAVSLDGYLADKAGGYAWITGHGDAGQNTRAQFCFETFLAGCGTVVMGRNAYDDCGIEHIDGWQEKHFLVASHRPRPADAPPNVEFFCGGLAEKVAEQKRRAQGGIWLFGGGQGDSGEKPGGCMWPGMPGCRLTAAVPLPLRRRKPPVPQESRSSMCPP